MHAVLDNLVGITNRDSSLVNQPVFPYAHMCTRKVGGRNARKNSLGTPARFLGH